MHLVLASLMKVSSANINLHLYWKLNVRNQYIAHLFSNNKQFSLSRIFLVKSVDGEPWQNEFSLTGLHVQNYHAGTKKSKERREEPLATLWNWSGKTLSPGALLAVLYFSLFHIYFSVRLDFPSPPSSAPGSRRMVFEQRNLPMSILPKSLLLAQAMFKLYKHLLRKGIIQKVS